MSSMKGTVLLYALLAGSLWLVAADPDCENLRERRDEMSRCCEVEKIIPLTDAGDCAPAADDASEPHEKSMCMLECKLTSLGVMNGDEIVQEKAFEYADRVQDDWKDTAKRVVSTCVETAKAVKNKMAEQGRPMKCSPVGGFFAMCLMKETFFQCPPDKWQNTSFCNKVKNGECYPKRD
ncbi:uncharacterized protein LOC126563191 [Anopheles maculipalpis]|uniref:uncharacterized protein LOC126563191 n=1 Tax=Anopheles maculipalpis TaxID=1496333 RepID=UPI0021593C3F|nr:uncharacterized protein LOC126563191 [Anopheles maculipalpis]